MALIESEAPVGTGLILHPSVGIAIDPARMTPRQKVAAIAKVAYLEHALVDCDRADRDGLVSQINELRHALGWLEVDLDGRWRWTPNEDA